jgi:hypothetical protein
LSVGEELGHRNLEKIIFVEILQRLKKYEKHRSKEEEGKGREDSFRKTDLLRTR